MPLFFYAFFLAKLNCKLYYCNMGNRIKFKKITKYAVKNGMSQEDLAQEIGIARHTLLRFKNENEKHHSSTIKQIDRFIKEKEI